MIRNIKIMRSIAVHYAYSPQRQDIRLAIICLLIDEKTPVDITKTDIYNVIRRELKLYGCQGIKAWRDLISDHDFDTHLQTAFDVCNKLFPPNP